MEGKLSADINLDATAFSPASANKWPSFKAGAPADPRGADFLRDG